MSDQAVKQGGYLSLMRAGQVALAEPSQQDESEYDKPEVLMYSRERKLLHANPRILGVAGHLDHSAPLLELRNAIQAELDLRRAANIWEPFELKRVLFEGRRRVLVRGLGLADRSVHDDSRVVIVIEERGTQEE